MEGDNEALDLFELLIQYQLYIPTSEQSIMIKLLHVCISSSTFKKDVICSEEELECISISNNDKVDILLIVNYYYFDHWMDQEQHRHSQ